MLKEAFLWLSATDSTAFLYSDKLSKGKRIASSNVVLLTAVFAFIGGSYFATTFFQYFNEETNNLEIGFGGRLMSLLIGLIWATFIMTIDRMIISSSSKLAVLWRIPLAISIGIVISIPLEMQLFSGKIQKQLIQNSVSENQGLAENLDKRLSIHYNELEDIKKTIKYEKEQMAIWLEMAQGEVKGRAGAKLSGIAGEGPTYRINMENYELHKAFMENAQNQLKTLEAQTQLLANNRNEEYNRGKIQQSYDFASMYEAFTELINDSSSLRKIARGITIVLILIECTPAIFRLLDDDEDDIHDVLVMAQNNIAKQAIIAYTNDITDKIAQHGGEAVFNQYIEYTPQSSIPKLYQNLN